MFFIFFQKTQDPSGDYEYLSRLKVYLGHVLQDENNNRSSECAPAIKYLIKHATDILCNLKNIQKDVNLTTVSSTVEDVMPEELKSLKSSSLMFMRDYVIFHKAENFGRLLKQKYFELFLDSTQRTWYGCFTNWMTLSERIPFNQSEVWTVCDQQEDAKNHFFAGFFQIFKLWTTLFWNWTDYVDIS